MAFDKVDIQYARLVFAKRTIVGLDNSLHYAFQRGRIAANFQLIVVRGDRRRGHGRHFDRTLGRLKALQRPLPQWVEDNNASASARRIMQLGHHPRTVSAGILPNHKNQIGVIEIFKETGSFADADRRG